MNEKYETSPVWLPDYSLSGNVKKMVADKLGQKHVGFVNFYCRQLLAKLENESCKPATKDVNEKIRGIDSCFFGNNKKTENNPIGIVAPGLVELVDNVCAIFEDAAVTEIIDKRVSQIFSGKVPSVAKEFQVVQEIIHTYRDAVEAERKAISQGNRKGWTLAKKEFLMPLAILWAGRGYDLKRIVEESGKEKEVEFLLFVKALVLDMGLDYETRKKVIDENGKVVASHVTGFKGTIISFLEHNVKTIDGQDRNRPEIVFIEGEPFCVGDLVESSRVFPQNFLDMQKFLKSLNKEPAASR